MNDKLVVLYVCFKENLNCVFKKIYESLVVAVVCEKKDIKKLIGKFNPLYSFVETVDRMDFRI